MALGEPSLLNVMTELSSFKISVQSTMSSHTSDLDYLKDVTMPIMKRDIKLTAAKVLKWSIGKKRRAFGATYKFTTKNVKTLMKVIYFPLIFFIFFVVIFE